MRQPLFATLQGYSYYKLQLPTFPKVSRLKERMGQYKGPEYTRHREESVYASLVYIAMVHPLLWILDLNKGGSVE